ncbi:MAG: hypothetical protein NDJ94_10015 [Vicinamibacteria bacterium]|nr:hypothetical protein [Vicinamibacteria bacterium]
MTTYRKLILHIGMGKTGTTSIQGFLKRNAVALQSAGFRTFGPGELPSCPQVELMDTARLQRALGEIRERSHGAHGVVWSLEGLGTTHFAADPARLEAIRGQLPASQVTIVVYLRRQDAFAASAYLQWNVVHKSYRGPVQSFDQRFPAVYGEAPGSPLEETNLNYHAVIRPWAEAFGVANLRVRPLETGQLVGGDLLLDFVEASGLPRLAYDFDVPRWNATFNQELSDLLGMYSSAFEGPVAPTNMVRFFRSFGYNRFFDQPFFTRFALPPQRRLEILEACQETNARVAREFLGRVDGVLFAEPWPSPDEPYRPYDGMTIEKLVPILLFILARQHEQLARHEARLARYPPLWQALGERLRAAARRVRSRLRRAVREP